MLKRLFINQVLSLAPQVHLFPRIPRQKVTTGNHGPSLLTSFTYVSLVQHRNKKKLDTQYIVGERALVCLPPHEALKDARRTNEPSPHILSPFPRCRGIQ